MLSSVLKLILRLLAGLASAVIVISGYLFFLSIRNRDDEPPTTQVKEDHTRVEEEERDVETN